MTGLWIPEDILAIKELSFLEKGILAQTIALSSAYGYCSASNSHFSEIFGCSDEFVSRSFSKMKKMGLITTEIDKVNGNKRRIFIDVQAIDVKSLPIDVKSLPIDVKSLPIDVKSLPIDVKSIHIKDENKYKANRKQIEEEESSATNFENHVPDFVKDEQQKKIKVFAPPVAVAPPQLEEIEQAMRNSMFLEEAGRRATKISELEYRDALELFFLENRGIEKVVKSESDYRRHFLNWLRIHAQKNKNNPDVPKKGKIQNNWDAAQAAKARLG